GSNIKTYQPQRRPNVRL
ncbi:gag_pre-integrs domain-containing protein, partial [Cephalotus follicularis]